MTHRLFTSTLALAAALLGCDGGDDPDADADRDADADVDADADLDADGDADADADGDLDADGAPDGDRPDADADADRDGDDDRLETAVPLWFSGFETGFPGEWLDYAGPNDDGSAGWDIVEAEGEVSPVEGTHMYKGWINDPAAESHRAYPVVHGEGHFAGHERIVNRWYVYLDADLSGLAPSAWIHFATWSSNPDWQVWTMSIRDGSVETAHLWNGGWSERVGDGADSFPMREWVRFTAYVDFSGEGYTRIWMDGLPILEGGGARIAGYDDALLRAHWGMYASGDVPAGVQYNDSIQVWALTEPWDDLESEPPSPYEGF